MVTVILNKAFKKATFLNKKLIIAGKIWQNRNKYIDMIGNDLNISLYDRFIPNEQVEIFFKACDIVVYHIKTLNQLLGLEVSL